MSLFIRGENISNSSGIPIKSPDRGTLNINSNGTFDVSSYKFVSVNMPCNNCYTENSLPDVNSVKEGDLYFHKSVILTNMLDPKKFVLGSGTTMDSEEMIYYSSGSGVKMVTQPMPDPIANHIYYGRCQQKTEPGYTQTDGRFEYFKNDSAQNVYTFGTFSDTNGQWVYISKAISYPSPGSSGFQLRTFTVNPSKMCYRQNLIIIDLTEAFGAGNEPTKEWCDENIPYFVGEKTLLL